MNQVITDCSQLRKLGNAYLSAADVIERASGIAQPTGGNLPTTTGTRVMSASTKRKIRAAHLKRRDLLLHQGGTVKKAA